MTAPVTPPGFSVVIPCVRSPTIEFAIESIRRQTRDDWELIVVMQGDDPCLRERVDAASARDSRVHGIWTPVKGVSRARNLGAQAAACDTVVFFDDDCEAAPDWLEHIRVALDEQPDVGFIAGSLIAPPRPRWRFSTCPSANPGDFTLRADPSAPTLPPGSSAVTANLAVRRWAWDRVGPFDELLGAGAIFRGGEDLDLLLRAIRVGVPIRFCPAAIVNHTYGRRYGARAVLRMIASYGWGQGAVAAKMTHTSTPDAETWNGARWRQQVWRDGVTKPLRSLRVLRVPRALPRLIAFERAYQRCLRDFEVDAAGLLVTQSPPS